MDDFNQNSKQPVDGITGKPEKYCDKKFKN